MPKQIIISLMKESDGTKTAITFEFKISFRRVALRNICQHLNDT